MSHIILLNITAINTFQSFQLPISSARCTGMIWDKSALKSCPPLSDFIGNPRAVFQAVYEGYRGALRRSDLLLVGGGDYYYPLLI